MLWRAQSDRPSVFKQILFHISGLFALTFVVLDNAKSLIGLHANHYLFADYDCLLLGHLFSIESWTCMPFVYTNPFRTLHVGRDTTHRLAPCVGAHLRQAKCCVTHHMLVS